MTNNQYSHIGDSVPTTDSQDKLSLEVEKALLFSLEKRGLITTGQRDQCILELEKQYMKELQKLQLA